MWFLVILKTATQNDGDSQAPALNSFLQFLDLSPGATFLLHYWGKLFSALSNVKNKPAKFEWFTAGRPNLYDTQDKNPL